MNDSVIKELTTQVANALLERGLDCAPNRRATIAFLRGTAHWEELDELLIPGQPMTCLAVLSLCRTALERIALTPQEGWLPYSYRYIQHLMFPQSQCFSAGTDAQIRGAQFYLTVLQVLLDWERCHGTPNPLQDFALLSSQEAITFDGGREYLRLLECYRKEYIYELMRIGQEITPFRTLGHIAGVHHIALTVARGLQKAGVQVDLSLISAAALSHDFGKFGCRPGERVPYLHYYYTDQWLISRRMSRVSHIASNHSTWDLELDSLSVESLCLIYADFRSKQDRDANGQEITVLYSLADAFAVILDKLDNVDEAKRRRYRLVYSRLHDFEDYMRKLGVDVELTGEEIVPPVEKNCVFLSEDETVKAIKLLSVEHNLSLMYHISNERKFGNLIESARSAKNWQQLRAYLDIFGEYSTYLSASQKSQALAFLHDLLIHRDGDVRRQAADLMGLIIAKFYLVYRKELPADVGSDPAEEVPFTLWSQYLDKVIYPDHKLTDQQRSHLGYTLKLIIEGVLTYGRTEDIPRFVSTVLSYYEHGEEMGEHTAFTLLDAISNLPTRYYGDEERANLLLFVSHFTTHQNPRLQTVALQYLELAAAGLPQGHPHLIRITDLLHAVPDGGLTVLFLKYKALKQVGAPVDYYTNILYQQDITSDLFLDNLKIATPWIVKVVGVEMLRDQIEQGQHDHILHISTHLTNLVKVSERVVVRHRAGESLISILPHLRREQRNEVVVELGKGLEMGQYEISKYIPKYLGEAALFLHPSELDEQLIWLDSLLASPNDSTVAGALNTLAVLLANYPAYHTRFPREGKSTYHARKDNILGLLLRGLAHYRNGVRQEALLVFGRIIFGSSTLSMEEKADIFSRCCRKLLFLIQEGGTQDDLSLFFRAAALSHVGRFITLWQLEHPKFGYHYYRKIAFFPGTFDPFTLSHKGIAQAIRELGYEVYLAIDEFSWSKKAQPHLIRRQIANQSIAGLFHVHLFPNDIPVNIANPADLKRLRQLFPQQEVYLVVGSDVIEGASSYRNPPTPFSVHSMNHLIFRRAGQKSANTDCIQGKVEQFQLPSHLEDISSTRIRENVDLNRDISTFVDPVIQDLIYQNGLYLRDRQDKALLGVGALDFQWIESPSLQYLQSLGYQGEHFRKACTRIIDSGDHLLVLYHRTKQQALGYLSYRHLEPSELFSALQDPHLAGRVRLRAGGKTLFITGLIVKDEERGQNHGQTLLSHLFACAVAEGCSYGMVFPHSGHVSQEEVDFLQRQGFLQHEKSYLLFEVDMRAPVVMLQNLETTIQEPLCYNAKVLASIHRRHKHLQAALSQLYPGNLVLTLSADIIHHRVLQRITAINEVPQTPTVPRQLGQRMCVPFGKLLRGKTVPNTVTKTIHTDRVFDPDLSTDTIETFPNYAPIDCQIRTIKSFDREVILVDDIIHEGHRIRVLDPILRKEKVDIRTILVGVMSGYGKDLMDAWNRPAESIYFIPSMRHWFVESTLYPFIGGNTVRRDVVPIPGMLPGINHILPYSAPNIPAGASREAIFQLSKCCLESSLEVIRVLEAEYRALYSRNLTLSRLAEAVILPLCPDKGTCLHYDPNLAASIYLENDLEQLLRSHRDMG